MGKLKPDDSHLIERRSLHRLRADARRRSVFASVGDRTIEIWIEDYGAKQMLVIHGCGSDRLVLHPVDLDMIRVQAVCLR